MGLFQPHRGLDRADWEDVIELLDGYPMKLHLAVARWIILPVTLCAGCGKSESIGPDEKTIQPKETTQSSPEQAVLVYLDGVGLPDHVYKESDLTTLEDRLTQLIKRDALGEYDGNEIGPTETTLYMYGPDAERLFAGIEKSLREYPLCRKSRVVIRRGGPSAAEREVRL
jgi:hypothetical protein